MAYADWYKVRAENFACNQHPGPPRALVKAFAEYTHIAEVDAAHVIDRIRHLSWCLAEKGPITLLRLQPGKNQKVASRGETGQLF